MIFLRTCDGAVKCLFLFFLREEDTILLNFIVLKSEMRSWVFRGTHFSSDLALQHKTIVPHFHLGMKTECSQEPN